MEVEKIKEMQEPKRAGATSALGRGLGDIAAEEETPAPESRTEVNVYVLSAAELPKDISFDYNARVPSRASRAYKSMRDTLRDNPERFLELNGGISLAHGRFVLDGGHTVTAIMDAIKEDSIDPSRIHLLVRDYGELTATEMERRSAALNRRVTPPLVGERDLEGDWQPIKEALSPKYHPLFEFRPNSKPNAPFGVEFLVALLNAWSETKGEKSYASKGKLVRHYTPLKYSRIMPKLNEAIDFWSHLYKAFLDERRVMALDCCRSPTKEKKAPEVTLPNGERVIGFIPEALMWPTFAAFSALLDEEGEWVAEPRTELARRKNKLVRQLVTDYKASGSDPGAYGKRPTNYLNAIIALRAGT